MIMDWFTRLQDSLSSYPWLYQAIAGVAVFLAALIIYFIAKFLLTRILLRMINTFFADNEAERKLARKAISNFALAAPIFIVGCGITLLPGFHPMLTSVGGNLCEALIVLTLSMALSRSVDLIDIFYHRKPVAQSKPIKGFLQFLKILIYLVSAILIIASLIDRNPLILLSGLGAMMAVLMLVFQDTILSVVASVQLGSNDMVRVGDWIEMPSQNADGDVIEIALHTVKVQNWDKTITTLPTRKLITDSFKNWRGMRESGGRRIKRSLYIDQHSVRFLNDAEIQRLEDFVLLDDYLDEKRRELNDWNSQLRQKGAKPINERRVTNLGTFRTYIAQYLRNNPKINQNMLMLVRQLQPGATGIPLEVYCFVDDVRWVQYEDAQSDLFDHLLAILPVFDLRVFQQISDTSGMMPAPALLNPDKPEVS
jgi:miniconductance mechanosensitive channel